MKKFLSITLILTLITAFTACSKKNDNIVDEPISDSSVFEEETDTEILDDAHSPSDSEDGTEDEQIDNVEIDDSEIESNTDEKAPIQNSQKDEEASNPTQNQSSTSDKKEPSNPKPEQNTPQIENTNTTLGNALLSDFKSQVSSNSSANAESIANAILANPAIEFNGAATQVEEGYLSGFDNTEIKGFSEGVMFAPVIGSIPFVGYVFTTSDSSSAQTLASTLKENANLRWNICVEAEEMICESIGNKVFFVMCPKSFE